MLMSAGTFLWFVAQATWTYYETYLGIEVPNAYMGDLLFFLHGVPIIAAAATQPHRDVPEADRGLKLGYLDFALLLVWWIFLYAYVVGPWQFVVRDPLTFGFRFDFLYTLENLMAVGCFMFLWLKAALSWKRVYGHLMEATCFYAA